MAPRRASLALAALLAAGRSGCSFVQEAEPSCPTNSGARPAARRTAPGLVLLQERFASSAVAKAAARGCAPFSQWPHVDNGITCVSCTALVRTAPHNSCDSYCESFGHVCAAAAEEVGDSCAVKHRAACDTVFDRTSDMLCTCRSPGAPVSVPAQLPPVCGSTRGCEHCPSGERPLHAGCFVVKEGKLLAHRITYGGRKFDLPGGQSNWREPASCTAHRETYEETGFEVTPTELLEGGLHKGGFNLYRCELLRDAPSKGPDHEVSGVWWLSVREVRDMVRRGQWRFPEASRYVEWMRQARG